MITSSSLLPRSFTLEPHEINQGAHKLAHTAIVIQKKKKERRKSI